MQMVDTEDADILLDATGQPIISDGLALLVINNDCWIQDIKMEAKMEEGELFFEDEDGSDAYGFGLMDFSSAEFDEFIEMEIEHRIYDKLSKRAFIDATSIKSEITFLEDSFQVRMRFNKLNTEYVIELEVSGAEVIIDD